MALIAPGVGSVAERLLDGVRVLELATEVAGPYCGRLLADLGAEVTKAEPPGGDPSRQRGPFPNGEPDPERSGLFIYLNAGKRRLSLDLDTAADRARLLDLAAEVEAIVESFAPGRLERLGLGFAALRARNPKLVLVSVTPFGQSGPSAGWQGSDLVAVHSSGFAAGFPARQVDRPDLPPLTAPGQAGSFLAGEKAAAATLHGLLAARQSGRGVHIDLSLQEAVGAENQSQHNAFEQSGHCRRTFTTEPSNPTVALLPCRDGWVAISPREEHQWTRWLEVMDNPPWAADSRFASRPAREKHWRELYPLLAAWSRERDKQGVFELAQAKRVACYPLGTARDLLASPQLAARQFFVEREVPGVGTVKMPGIPYKVQSSGFGVRSSLGQLRTPNPSASGGRTLPLAGVRIIDFSWVMTGPICTKTLAALGAEVIKIESRARPDLSHRNVSWEELNPSKRSFTLNLKHEAARDLARRLIGVSDIVVENFSTGVMERLGLDYPRLHELNPSIIMASSSALGRTGPEAERIAYGTLIQCFTGWAGLAAYPGLPPRSAAGIWTDPLTASLEMVLLLAAIWRQRATGQGCFFDISMAETQIAGLPEPILAWTVAGEVAEPRGNRDPLYAPQGCYPVTGEDRWVALSVRSDDEWAALARLIERDDLLGDPGLRCAAARRARHDELDAAIAAWTRQRSARDAAEQLQAAGIAAAPTLTAEDILEDEHLQARRFTEQIESLSGGTRWTLGVPWLVDGQRPGGFRRGPRVGEDNAYVCRELLGLDQAEYERLVDEEIVF